MLNSWLLISNKKLSFSIFIFMKFEVYLQFFDIFFRRLFSLFIFSLKIQFFSFFSVSVENFFSFILSILNTIFYSFSLFFSFPFLFLSYIQTHWHLFYSHSVKYAFSIKSAWIGTFSFLVYFSSMWNVQLQLNRWRHGFCWMDLFLKRFWNCFNETFARLKLHKWNKKV